MVTNNYCKNENYKIKIIINIAKFRSPVCADVSVSSRRYVCVPILPQNVDSRPKILKNESKKSKNEPKSAKIIKKSHISPHSYRHSRGIYSVRVIVAPDYKSSTTRVAPNYKSSIQLQEWHPITRVTTYV